MYPKPTVGPGLCACGCGKPALKQYAHGHSRHNGPVEFWRRIPNHLPADVCWPWPGPLHADGYGAWGAQKVHHLMGPDRAPGQLVRHTCDNPRCCNPAHLLVGTQTDNMRDMVERGRESRPAAKITRADADTIRTRYETGETSQAALAREYDLSPQHVYRIVHRKRWK